MKLTRRDALSGVAGTIAAASIGGRAEARQARIKRRMVIPAVDAFEDYDGQFVFIDEPVDADATEVPVGECEFASTWPAEETKVYEGQLLDRRQEVPLAVDLKVYTNGNKAQIEPATHFIIQNTHACPGGYIGLEAESVPRQALAGKPPGPTVTGTATDGPGFGVIVGLGSAASGGVLAALRRLRKSE